MLAKIALFLVVAFATSAPAQLDPHRMAEDDLTDSGSFRAVISLSTSDIPTLAVGPRKICGDGIEFLNLVSVAYQTSFYRVINQAPPLDARYRVSVVAPKGREDLLYPGFQRVVADTFGIRVRRETREMNVSVLRRGMGELQLSRSRAGEAQHWFVDGKIHAIKQPIATLVDVLENFLDRAVVDETGLEGEFDWELSYRRADETTVVNSVRNELGLEILPATRAIEVLIVEAADPADDGH